MSTHLDAMAALNALESATLTRNALTNVADVMVPVIATRARKLADEAQRRAAYFQRIAAFAGREQRKRGRA